MTSATAATSSSPSHGCITLIRDSVMSFTATVARPCGDLLAQRTPPLDERAQALLEADLGDEPEVALGRRRVRESSNHTVHGPLRAVLDGQV